MLFLSLHLRRWNVFPWATYVDVAISLDPAQLCWHWYYTLKCEFSIMLHRFNQLVHVSLLFYAPEIENQGAYCFCPVCYSVMLSLCHPLWIFNLADKFWTVNAKSLIFHMNIPCYKTFPWVPIFFTLWPWPWSFTHFIKKKL